MNVDERSGESVEGGGIPLTVPSQPALIVDDSHTMLMIMARLMGKIGFHDVEYVQTAAHALERLNNRKFCLVIADVEMPGHGGLDLVRAMRAATATRKVPVLLVTASLDQSHISRAKAEGVDGYLLKPFTAQALHHAVTDAIGPVRVYERPSDAGAAAPVKPRNVRVTLFRHGR